MADRGIQFSGPMVRALQQGRKTQTRRAGDLRYAVGDRLYVREHWRADACIDHMAPRDMPHSGGDWVSVRYEADGYGPGVLEPGKFRQAMHMPRWASRLFLVVTEVRSQRLHSISYEDAIAEGVEMESADPPFYYVPGLPTSGIAVGIEEPGGNHAQRCYFNLLDHLHGAGFSAKNPKLSAYTFTVHYQNIDKLEAA